VLDYLDLIEEATGVPVAMFSTSPDREDTYGAVAGTPERPATRRVPIWPRSSLLALGLAAPRGARLARGARRPGARPYGLQPEFECRVGARRRAPARGVVRLPAAGGARHVHAVRARRRRGRYGLMWDDGGGIGHGPSAGGGARRRRASSAPDGGRRPPPRAGAAARLDVTLHRRDPLADLGVPFEDVRIAGPGRGRRLVADRGSDAAVVMVHGRRRGDRTEALRALPTAVAGARRSW
jgi:hypothetical protein